MWNFSWGGLSEREVFLMTSKSLSELKLRHGPDPHRLTVRKPADLNGQEDGKSCSVTVSLGVGYSGNHYKEIRSKH